MWSKDNLKKKSKILLVSILEARASLEFRVRICFYFLLTNPRRVFPAMFYFSFFLIYIISLGKNKHLLDTAIVGLYFRNLCIFKLFANTDQFSF